MPVRPGYLQPEYMIPPQTDVGSRRRIPIKRMMFIHGLDALTFLSKKKPCDNHVDNLVTAHECILVFSPGYVEDEQHSGKDHSYQHNYSYEN